jgi:hypothetical protein
MKSRRVIEKDKQLPLTEYKELKKANGDVFFEARRKPDNSYIAINWIGLQSLETVMLGCNQILAMLREKPCPRLLNSNRELVGPWEVAVSWLVYKWAPQANALGLRYFAHVLSPGVFGQRSFRSFQDMLKGELRVKGFEEEQKAEDWLMARLF